MMLLKKVVFNKLVEKVNDIDTNRFVWHRQNRVRK